MSSETPCLDHAPDGGAADQLVPHAPAAEVEVNLQLADGD
jgi:hypothetical protein